MDSIHNLLKQLIIPYGDLSDESLKRVFKHFHVKELKKGEYFSKAGDLRQIVGIQFSGILRSYLVTDKGIEKTTDFSRKGDILTTIETEIPSIKWIQALNNSTIATINRSQFEKLIEQDLAWQIIIRKMTESYFILKAKREIELLSLDAAQKYELFLCDFRDIASNIPQYHIASYLGISPVSLSRLRAYR